MSESLVDGNGTGNKADVTSGKRLKVETILVDDVTGKAVNVEQNGGLAVNIQDQHSRMLDLRFIQAVGAPTTLLTEATIDTYTIDLTDTTGFVDGNSVALFTAEGDFYFGQQVGAPVGSTVTLDSPLDFTFPAGSNAISAISNMNVDGSVTRQIFQIGPVGLGTNLDIDITRIIGTMTDGTAMDDSLFGSITALTNGIVLRQNNGSIQNIWNIKSNGEFSLFCYDLTYSDKAPAGSFGLKFRNSFAGQEKHGVTIRLEPGDILELLIQDDLTDLDTFNVMAQGHIVTD